MMTRMHFEQIALAVRHMNLSREDREEVALKIARVCADSNPRFDMHRFVDACTPYA
jgi:uncharacterized protein YciW